jgi:ABC-type dipeptide/oligopeptide/nickel transport system permease component
VLTLFLISVITFLSINALGIDVARNAIGRQATEEQVAIFNEEHDLTGSLAER